MTATTTATTTAATAASQMATAATAAANAIATYLATPRPSGDSYRGMEHRAEELLPSLRQLATSADTVSRLWQHAATPTVTAAPVSVQAAAQTVANTTPVVAVPTPVAATDLASLSKADLLDLCKANGIRPLLGAGKGTLVKQLTAAKVAPVVVAQPAPAPVAAQTAPVAAPVAPVASTPSVGALVSTALKERTLGALQAAVKAAGLRVDTGDFAAMESALKGFTGTPVTNHVPAPAPIVAPSAAQTTAPVAKPTCGTPTASGKPCGTVVKASGEKCRHHGKPAPVVAQTAPTAAPATDAKQALLTRLAKLDIETLTQLAELAGV